MKSNEKALPFRLREVVRAGRGPQGAFPRYTPPEKRLEFILPLRRQNSCGELFAKEEYRNAGSCDPGQIRVSGNRREGQRRDRAGLSGPAGGRAQRHGRYRREAGGQDLQPADLRGRERKDESEPGAGRWEHPGGEPVHPLRRHLQPPPRLHRRGEAGPCYPPV